MNSENNFTINWDNLDEHIIEEVDEITEEFQDIEKIEEQWTSNGTTLLISLRVLYSEEFLKAKKKGKKNELWEIISGEMINKKYKFSARQCDEKWRRLLTQYRRIHDLTKKSGHHSIKWQYFKLMEEALCFTIGHIPNKY